MCGWVYTQAYIPPVIRIIHRPMKYLYEDVDVKGGALVLSSSSSTFSDSTEKKSIVTFNSTILQLVLVNL